MRRISPVSCEAVDITGGFWKARQDINERVTVPVLLQNYIDTGRIGALSCSWKEGMPLRPHHFWDSDVAKWIEGAAYILQKHPDKQLEDTIEDLIDTIASHAASDGYFNSYFLSLCPEKRFTDRGMHELYCAGHLTEAAIAWKHATGRSRFLDVMRRYIDLIDRVFRLEDSAAFSTPGHEEIELALIRLYRETKEKRYLDLCLHFLNSRGQTGNKDYTSDAPQHRRYYYQSHLPVRRQFTAEGHSVRAGYLYSAMADAAVETDDEELKYACERLFENITERRMYITGGTGSEHTGENFTADYDLPSQTAYTETCAAISLAYFAHRMQQFSPDVRYADTVERVMYNGYQAATSLDGTTFYYSDPIELDVSRRHDILSTAKTDWLPVTTRVTGFSCSCCPPNIVRFTASVAGFMYTQDEDTVYLHQFMDSTASPGGSTITVSTSYPVSGDIRIRADMNDKTLAVRIPGWCDSYTVSVPCEERDHYLYIDPAHAGDVHIVLDMTPRLYEASDEVYDAAGKAALFRGPVLYCAEGLDNPEPLQSVMLPKDAVFAEEKSFAPYDLPVLSCEGFRHAPRDNSLYHRFDASLEPCTVRLIPYFATQNRGETDMRIYLPVRR